MKSAAIILSGLGLLAATHASSPAAAADHAPASRVSLSTIWWQPTNSGPDNGPEWQWELDHPLSIGSATDMGIGATNAAGQVAANPTVFDIGDSYTDNNGFGITEAQDAAYDNTLGTYAHSLGLAWGQKNGDQDQAFAKMQEPVADFLLTEECNYYHTCATVTAPYVAAHKLVLNAEYTDDWGTSRVQDLRKFCPADLSGGIDGVLFTSALSGQHHPCQ